jgi:DNA recombination protein RmuC
MNATSLTREGWSGSEIGLVVVFALLVVLIVLHWVGARQASRDLREGLREQRAELGASLDRNGQQLVQQMAALSTVQNQRIAAFEQQLAKLTDANETRLREIRATLEARLTELSRDNQLKLDEMRRTVDEKLQATLEQRLTASFTQVAQRLEQVHKGLGEMQALAGSVGDLKRVLANVKTRGQWGEVQLAALLEQVLSPEQYASNVATVEGSNDRVEFAIRLPGTGRAGSGEAPVWLPIDAKFPMQYYERVVLAQEQAEPGAVEAALKALAQRVRDDAKQIRSKYISVPSTTDFGLMFLPTEGLYAEVARQPGLLDDLQREHRVVVAGPTTLGAILTSLQMGFRTLAVEQRSSEVWQLLGAVKTEFGQFGDVLAKTHEQLQRAAKTIDSAAGRTRKIERQLRSVQTMPAESARTLLGLEPDQDGDLRG